MFFKDDKLTKNKSIGCLIGFVGVMLCTFNGGAFSFHLNGEFLILLSCIFSAISGVISKKATEKADPYTVAGYNLGFGGLVLCLIGYSLKGKLVLANSSAIPLLLVLSLLSAIAFSIWTKLLKVNKVGEVSVFQFVNPVAGVFFSGIILGEDILQLRYLFAVILITLGILVVFSKMKDSGGQYDKRRSSSTI